MTSKHHGRRATVNAAGQALQRRGVDSGPDDLEQPKQPPRFRGAGVNAAVVASLATATYVWATATQDQRMEIGSAVAFTVAMAVIVIVLICKTVRRER